MSIEYNEYDLLEIFKNEPDSLQEGAGIYFYKSNEDKSGFILYLSFSYYEETGTILLKHKDLIDNVIEFELSSLKKIVAVDCRLDFYSTLNKPFIRVYFKPGLSIKCNI